MNVHKNARLTIQWLAHHRAEGQSSFAAFAKACRRLGLIHKRTIDAAAEISWAREQAPRTVKLLGSAPERIERWLFVGMMCRTDAF